jgi:hypothetical protein
VVPAIIAGVVSLAAMVGTGAYPDNPFVQFVTSFISLAAIVVAVILVGKDREPGARLSWGEAMFASFVVFFAMFWAYGVVPHYFLTMADNQFGWRPDSYLGDYVGLFTPQDQGGGFPLTISMQTIRDLLVVGLYIVFLGVQIALFAWWNDRAKKAPSSDVVTSDYGRPLVRRG